VCDVTKPAQPGPQLLAHSAELAVLALLDEVDDGAVIEVIAHGEENPVPVGASGDDDLVACRGAHDGGIA